MERVTGGEEVAQGKWERRQRWWTDNLLRQIRRYRRNMRQFYIAKLLCYMYKLFNLGKGGTLAP